MKAALMPRLGLGGALVRASGRHAAGVNGVGRGRWKWEGALCEGRRRWRMGALEGFSTSAGVKADAGEKSRGGQQRKSPSINQSKPSTASPPTPLPKPRITPQAFRQNIASRLSALPRENIYNVPNILTFSRLLATPVIGYLVVHNQHAWAVSLFAYAGITDLVDGWIARKWKLQTVVGSVVDPMADKILMTTLVGCLAINGSLPLPLATLILGRDASLAIAAIYYRWTSLPSPKTLTRYWDFSLPSAEVHPTTISKLNTFLQLGLIGATLTLPLLVPAAAGSSESILKPVADMLGGTEGVHTIVRALQGVVATTTVWSGVSYIWTKDAVRILGDDEVLKRKQGFRGRMVVGGTFGIVLAVTGVLAWRDWSKAKEDETEVE